jgi:hypothetical protein
LDFTAIGGKRQGHEVPQSLKITRLNRVQSPAVAGLGKPNHFLFSNMYAMEALIAKNNVNTGG